MKRLKPFWSFYGAKYNLASKYCSPIGDSIVEPFAGSAQYSLLHYRKNVQLYDIDENICMIWDYLIKAKTNDIKRLTLDFECIDDLQGYTQEEKVLMGFWCGKAISVPQKKPSKFALHKNTPDYKRRAINQVKYIRHWKIKQCSYNEIPNMHSTWFIDPPYTVGGHKYRFSKIDYQHLSTWCKNRKGLSIVCENNQADWLPFRRLSYARSCYTKKCNNIEVVFIHNNGEKNESKDCRSIVS